MASRKSLCRTQAVSLDCTPRRAAECSLSERGSPRGQSLGVRRRNRTQLSPSGPPPGPWVSCSGAGNRLEGSKPDSGLRAVGPRRPQEHFVGWPSPATGLLGLGTWAKRTLWVPSRRCSGALGPTGAHSFP